MRLYIAEKPSLGRAIADALPKPHEKGDGYIRVGNGDVVSWCIGHLLEQVDPEQYDPAFKRWQWETLPIIPQQWKLTPRAACRGQLAVLKRWLKEADEIVHAGDPDREGQLLVDEVVAYLDVSKARRDAMLRCLISDLNLPAVRRALDQLRSNREFMPLSVSALARSRADWLYGINMTRAYTLLAKAAGNGALLSVGRVQTPVLGLVVRRDAEIAGFVSKPYYEVDAHLRSQAGASVIARWQPSEACRPWQDEEGRVLHRPLAERVLAKITDQSATVVKQESKLVKQAPPLPFNLSQLQMAASRQLGLTAQQVLDLCQQLYERHKLITYPRSDCRYLPREQLQQASEVRAAIGRVASELSSAVAGVDPGLVSAAWNDQKVSAHHAIIPTAKGVDPSRLSALELSVYTLIARQYLMQFYPSSQCREGKIEFAIAGGCFVARGKEWLLAGWRALLSSRSETNEDEEAGAPLPVLADGERLHCERGELLCKQTQPPKPFTEATLLAAMTGIARYVAEPELRKILRDTDGLGTEATRAGIIELLCKRQFLERQGKSLRSTATGQALIHALPDEASWPDMTARWEHALGAIEQQQLSYREFISPLETTLQQLVTQARDAQSQASQWLADLPAAKPAARWRKGGTGGDKRTKRATGAKPRGKSGSAKARSTRRPAGSTSREAV